MSNETDNRSLFLVYPLDVTEVKQAPTIRELESLIDGAAPCKLLWASSPAEAAKKFGESDDYEPESTEGVRVIQLTKSTTIILKRTVDVTELAEAGQIEEDRPKRGPARNPNRHVPPPSLDDVPLESGEEESEEDDHGGGL